VLPLSRNKATGWSEGLGVPFGGRTVLYTGLMYQLMPSMIALEKILARFEHSPFARLVAAGRIANRIIDFSRLAPLAVNRRDQEMFDSILRTIVLLLRAADVDFGYLYDEELYAGALAHDEGMCSVFEKHALRVHALFERHGVRRVITVDPHTTSILRSVYPRVTHDRRLDVKSYLEVLAERGMESPNLVERSVAIHDSCVYARHEGVVEEPRQLLRQAGVQIKEPEHSGKMTFCCGGPIESLFPGKARSIAEARIRQLAAASGDVITMCPICMVNLRGAAGNGVSVEDISGCLAAAHCA
jgi:Fe-S oxidoreductase